MEPGPSLEAEPVGASSGRIFRKFLWIEEHAGVARMTERVGEQPLIAGMVQGRCSQGKLSIETNMRKAGREGVFVGNSLGCSRDAARLGPSRQRRAAAGFTLLEIASVIVVIGILASLVYPVFKGFRGRAEALQCAANLKALGVAVHAYMADHQDKWPQIERPEKRDGGNVESSPVSSAASQVAEQWMAVLAPYGISEKTWHCPSVERQIRQQAKKGAASIKRIDYTPTIFDAKPGSATQWAKHPWFVERGALHATGPNVLFTDGSVSNLSELAKAPLLSR